MKLQSAIALINVLSLRGDNDLRDLCSIASVIHVWYLDGDARGQGRDAALNLKPMLAYIMRIPQEVIFQYAPQKVANILRRRACSETLKLSETYLTTSLCASRRFSCRASMTPKGELCQVY